MSDWDQRRQAGYAILMLLGIVLVASALVWEFYTTFTEISHMIIKVALTLVLLVMVVEALARILGYISLDLRDDIRRWRGRG